MNWEWRYLSSSCDNHLFLNVAGSWVLESASDANLSTEQFPALSGLGTGGFWIPVRWQSLHESGVELQEGRGFCMLFCAHFSQAEENAWLQLSNSMCVECYLCRIWRTVVPFKCGFCEREVDSTLEKLTLTEHFPPKVLTNIDNDRP